MFVIGCLLVGCATQYIQDEDTVPLFSFNRASKSQKTEYGVYPEIPTAEDYIPLSKKDKQHLTRYAFSILKAYFGDSKPVKKKKYRFDYDKLFVTIYNNGKVRGCIGTSRRDGGQERIYRDIKRAVIKSIEDERFGGALSEAEIPHVEIVFNILFNRKRLHNRDISSVQRQVEPGIHALEMVQGKQKAIFKESVPIVHNYSLKKMIERLIEKGNIDEKLPADLFRYDTLTFKGTGEAKISDLYRYNILIEPDAVDKQKIETAVSLIWQWFSSSINKATGRLKYMYLPSQDKYAQENNHVRQLAALWTITEVRQRNQDHSLDGLIQNTIDHYVNFVKAQGGYAFLEIDGRATIAYNAFLIMVLNNFEKYPDRLEWLDRLANAILNQQTREGSLKTYFNSDRTSGIDYYPGEALLALMKLYGQTGETKYLEAVERAFPYYRIYWRLNKNTAFVPWQTQAYFLLFQENKNPELADFIFEMSDWVIDNHQIKKSRYKDKIGGFPKGMPRNATGVYLEGINDAYTLAKQLNDTQHIAKYAGSLTHGIRFLLQIQFTPQNTFYLKNPNRAIGGFKQSLVSNYLRIDYAQHAVMALMKASQKDLFKP